MEKNKKEKLKHLGRFIKYCRTIRNKTMCQIEKENSIDRALWSKLENGKLTSMPKPELLMNIAEIIDCNCIDLYKIVGYIKDSDVMRYVTESHRVREKDSGRKSMKP